MKKHFLSCDLSGSIYGKRPKSPAGSRRVRKNSPGAHDVMLSYDKLYRDQLDRLGSILKRKKGK